MSRANCLFAVFALAFGVTAIFSLAGCSPANSGLAPELVAKHRARLTLAEEPDGAMLVSEVRKALLGQDDEHADHDAHEHGHDDHADHDHADHEAVVKATEPMDVVLVGRIGGLANPWQETQPDFPFAKNQAAFFLADPQAVAENEEGGHTHAPGEECAFCEAHATDRSAMLAMVRFVDENGSVLRADVRRLFDVEEGDTVVVRGAARVAEGGMMVVDATGLYVRR